MNYSKKHLKIVLYVPTKNTTPLTIQQIFRWYGQIERTEHKKNRPNELNKCSELRMK